MTRFHVLDGAATSAVIMQFPDLASATPPSWLTLSLSHKEALREFVAIDVETTGADSKKDYITEIAAVRFVDGVAVSQYSSLIKPPPISPGVYVSKEISNFTHITNEDLHHAPHVRKVMREFADFVGESVVVGHNIFRFDSWFILTALSNCNIVSSFYHDAVDTLLLARNLKDVQPEKYKLGVLASYLDLAPQGQLHRALADAEVTGRVMVELMRRMPHGAFPGRSRQVRPRFLNLSRLISAPTGTTRLGGDQVAVAGTLKTMSYASACQHIVNHGGIPAHELTWKVRWVLEGDIEHALTVVADKPCTWRLEKFVKRLPELQSRSYVTMEVITEERFCSLPAVVTLTSPEDHLAA